MDIVNGERYLGCGGRNVRLELKGTAGNALGAYLDSGHIELFGNAQDQVADTMNGGVIIIHGSCGDTTGYAMRGGALYIEKSVGYRAGVHMKSYADVSPVMVVGDFAGSFLGEYQAGGDIVVLNLGNRKNPTGDFTSVGMYGGRIFIRSEEPPDCLPAQVQARLASDKDLEDVEKYIRFFCSSFSKDPEQLLSSRYFVLAPNTGNPYKQMYVNM